jgi:hypothetical protein
MAMRKLLAQLLSGSTTSDKWRDLFDESKCRQWQHLDEELPKSVVELTGADQEMKPVAEVSRFLFSGKRGSRPFGRNQSIILTVQPWSA